MSSTHIYSDIEFPEDFNLREEVLEELSRKINEAPIDTKDSLANFIPFADSFQERVIESTDHTIRLVAPAGSGKTQTIINRILVKVKKGESPNRILVLTFDNSAVASIKAKYHEEIERLPYKPVGLKISTLNAFGYGLLREYIPLEFKNVVTESRLSSIVREGLNELKLQSPERFGYFPTNIRNRFFREFYSLLKNQLFDPRAFSPQMVADFLLKNEKVGKVFFAPQKYEATKCKKIIEGLLWLFKAYDFALQRDKVLDFDDQKLRAFVSLQENPGLLVTIQSQFAEIIVDEFQDINKLDFELIKALAEKSGLVVTGDDDQAIYGFRGCSPDYIIDLAKHLGRQVSSYELQKNYRCPKNIVEHADHLIRHNVRRIVKNPVAASNNVSQIKVIGSLASGIEAKTVVSFIKKLLKRNKKLNYSDFAVLYRTNAQSLPLQIEFLLNDIPYFVRKEDNILFNEMIEKLLGVLRLKLSLSSNRDPRSADQLLTIQAYFRFLNASQADKLEELFKKQDHFLEAITSRKFLSILPKAKESKLVDSVEKVLAAENLIETFDVLAKHFHGLQGMIGSFEDVIEEKVPLGELYDVAANFKGKVADFVVIIEQALTRARISNAGTNEKSGVGLLTYFKAKGLQWHTVILTSCNQGLIPHSKASLEEERRLFYVAMTRPSSNLLISYLKKICKNDVGKSQFINEAGLV